MEADESYECPSSGRLVEILREENASLKLELETYYQRVCRLQKVFIWTCYIYKIVMWHCYNASY